MRLPASDLGARGRGRTPGATGPLFLLGATLALFLAGTAFAPGSARAESLERLWTQANEAFFQGNYSQAVEDYEQLRAAGVDDADVYFNLATAYARAGELGYAVLNYERALWRAPGDGAAEAGRRAAQNALGSQRAARAGEATLRTRPPLSEALVQPFSADTLAWLWLVLEVAFFALLLLRPRLRSEGMRVGSAIALPLLALGFCLSAAALSIKTETWKTGSAAIVVHDDAPLREGPDGRATVRAKVLEGQSVRVLEREANYARVRLPGGETGWLSGDDFGLVRPN